MKHAIASLREAVHERRVAHVAQVEFHAPRSGGGGEVLLLPTEKVVEHADLRGTRSEKLVGDVRAHQSRTPGHQESRAFNGIHF